MWGRGGPQPPQENDDEDAVGGEAFELTPEHGPRAPPGVPPAFAPQQQQQQQQWQGPAGGGWQQQCSYPPAGAWQQVPPPAQYLPPQPSEFLQHPCSAQQQQQQQAELQRLGERLRAAEAALHHAPPPPVVSPPLEPAPSAPPQGGLVLDRAAAASLAQFHADCRPALAGYPELARRLEEWTGFFTVHGLRAGPPQKVDSLPVVGSTVEVRCAQDDGPDRWDPAVVTAADEASGMYTVRFPDGEEWDRLPLRELRRPGQPEELRQRDAEIAALRQELALERSARKEVPPDPPAEAAPVRTEHTEDASDDRGPAPQPPRRAPRPAVRAARPREKRQASPAPEPQWELQRVGDDDLVYSGWLWRLPDGWLGSRSKVWLIIIGSQLYMGSSPSDPEFELMPLQGVTVASAGEGAQALHISWRCEDGEELRFSAESESERAAWAAHLEAAAIRARRAMHGDAERMGELERALRRFPCRPCVPVIDPAQPPETGDDKTLLCGNALISTTRTWLGSPSWERRWVTLHEAYLTHRPERGSPAGVEVVPLRETDLSDRQVDGEHSSALQISGPWVSEMLLTVEGVSVFQRWRAAFRQAHARSNPEPQVATARQAAGVVCLGGNRFADSGDAHRPGISVRSDNLRKADPDSSPSWGSRRRPPPPLPGQSAPAEAPGSSARAGRRARPPGPRAEPSTGIC
eukprot:TRINITY_DN5477_c0_g2_i1.p1 TRINITY_DN5477_c0_g2~~TRINITY_DN5477_c0_g2_i1.p1  ORF type:complete len:716 (+),score=179.92 TRINITY_DN5477_c0_g2_i1:80-2149(+)